jgi:very-short-patch-repair endonuclease
LDQIATAQHGLVTWAQLRRLGLAEATIAGWRESGRLITVQPRVDRLAGAPVTYHQKLLAAVLSAGPGAAASHRSAARLWVPAEVHHTRDPIPIIRRRGVPTTNPMRTIVDLGAVCGKRQVEDALDQALVARLCSIAAVEWELASLARPGRRGAGTLHAVLDRRALADARPDGLLEPRFARLVRRYDLPRPQFQYRVGRYRLDFAYPDRRLGVEVDGYAAHAGRRAFQQDRDRQNALAALGWTLVRFTWDDVVRRPARVARTLGQAWAEKAA